jgi:hypothetical protein
MFEQRQNGRCVCHTLCIYYVPDTIDRNVWHAIVAATRGTPDTPLTECAVHHIMPTARALVVGAVAHMKVADIS